MKQSPFFVLIIGFLLLSCIPFVDFQNEEPVNTDDKVDEITEKSLFDQGTNNSSKTNREDYRPLMMTIAFVLVLLIVAACLKVLFGSDSRKRR